MNTPAPLQQFREEVPGSLRQRVRRGGGPGADQVRAFRHHHCRGDGLGLRAGRHRQGRAAGDRRAWSQWFPMAYHGRVESADVASDRGCRSTPRSGRGSDPG